MPEEWKPLTGYEAKYKISNLGNVFSFKYNKMLIPCTDNHGYKYIRIYSVGGSSICPKLHRLVANHFIPNPCNKPQINHIDGNKANNCVTNLEWATNGENGKHAIRTGLRTRPKGENSPTVKLTDNEVVEIRKLLHNKVAGVEIARMFNISPQVISRINKGQRKTTYEF